MISDAAMLARIRDQHAAINPGQWTRVVDGEGTGLEARGLDGSLFVIARFHPGAAEAEIAFAVDAAKNVGFLLSLVDRAIVFASRAAGAPAGRPSDDARSGLRPAAEDAAPPLRGENANLAAEAAIKCGEPAFKKFLMERHGLESPATTERTAQKLRSLCGVTSRRELNDGGAAAAAWRALRDEFKAWGRERR